MAGKGGKRSTSWPKGVSGNPRGPKPGLTNDIKALAQFYTPDAIQALVDALSSKGERVAAANILLNRGYGMPKQTLENQTLDKDGNPTAPVAPAVAVTINRG